MKATNGNVRQRVEVGQIWRSMDNRTPDRYVKVLAIGTKGQQEAAQVRNCTSGGVSNELNKTTWIRLERMMPHPKGSTGWELYSQIPGEWKGNDFVPSNGSPILRGE